MKFLVILAVMALVFGVDLVSGLIFIAVCFAGIVTGKI